MFGPVAVLVACLLLGAALTAAFLLAARGHDLEEYQRDRNAADSSSILDEMERIRDEGEDWDHRPPGLE